MARRRKPLTRAQVKKTAHNRKMRMLELITTSIQQKLPKPPTKGKGAAELAAKPVPASPPLRIPTVLNEWQTLYRVLNGCSISRYGDGEVKHMEGKRNVSQEHNRSLSRAVRAVFTSRLRNHLVAIPNVFNGRAFLDVNQGYIDNMQLRFIKVADPDYTYGSAYISRGDLCGYLTWASYWSTISELWNGRDVVLVRGLARRANPANMMAKARNIAHVETPMKNAWEEYGRIFKECLRHPKEGPFLLCVGPTATVLAADLARHGRWAVDLGHLGVFYRKWGRKAEEDA